MNTTPFPPVASKPRAAWWADLPASIVVFMVALPLCLAIAQACGVPPEAGIITGIIGGLVLGWLAGCPLQVSGPAAGLLVLVLELVRAHGQAGLGVAVFIAGLLQLTAAWLRFGQWFRAVSPAVIHGMLAGIGLVIMAKQFHVLVDAKPADSVIENISTIPHAIAKAFNDHDGEYPHHLAAAAVGLWAIFILVTWKLVTPKWLHRIPAALVAVVAAALLSQWLHKGVLTVQVQSNLWSVVKWLPTTDRSVWLNPEILKAALVISFIASAESLLCAAAVDRMRIGARTQYNRELAAQGVGNVLCGFLGVLPMTGVIVRSAANVEAGARSRLSAVFHGAWLLLFVTYLSALLTNVPTTALAAILIVTGYNLLDLPGIKALWRTSRSEVAILIVTALTIVSTDLLIGVVTGVALSVAKLVWTFSHLSIRLDIEPDQRKAILHLRGAATFLRPPFLADELERVPANAELHTDLTHLTYVDHACLELLLNWEKQHHSTGGRLVLDWDSLHARFRSPRMPADPPPIASAG
ncbi:MAG: SulP family inorganic anion transporter [Gemmataceae bacterium]